MPRVLATLIVLPLLTAVAIVIGVLGSRGDRGARARHPRRATSSTLRCARRRWRDLLSGLAKTVFFGFNIAIVACHLGHQHARRHGGRRPRTTQTVVITSVVTLVSDFFLTKLFLAIGWES